MPQLNENTSSNIHFFLDRTTATHPIEHHLVVRNSHDAAEANQSVSSPNEETFQAPERDGLSVHVLNQENSFAVTGSPLMGGASSPLRVISGHVDISTRCPLYPRKRTFAHAIRMSALGQKATSTRLLNQIVCGGQGGDLRARSTIKPTVNTIHVDVDDWRGEQRQHLRHQ
jgi:hypothetical protein